MVKMPNTLIDDIANHAVAGILARLECMALTPASIAVHGYQAATLAAQLHARYPSASPQDKHDLIVVNLDLAWLADMANWISAYQAQLKPNGLLMFTTFGPDTLQEWPHQDDCLVNRIDMHVIGDALVQAGLADPVMEVEHFDITYAQSTKMLAELRAGKLLCDTANGEVPAQDKWHLTCELVYGHAWFGGHERRADKDGVTSIPLSSLREQLLGRR